MASTTMQVGELLYEETFQITGVGEYGLSMPDVLSGKTPVPPQGARFDVAVKGQLAGARLGGTIVATDYVAMRADGNTRVHVHGDITTKEGDRIAFFADGVFAPGAPAQLRENVTLYTACSRYAWVNQLQIWATGTVDLAKGEAKLKAYTA
jgi:hypothetical protein